jgi:5-methylthioadenosine/S-adenosylhomocysteine deaminase
MITLYFSLLEGDKMEKKDLLLKNGTLYTVNEKDEVLKNAYIVVNQGKIEKITTNVEEIKKYEFEKTLNIEGKVVFPGFVNTHIHIFQSLLKGLGADHRLIKWLNLSALPYGEKLGSDLQYEAARLASMEALQSGCTSLCEFFYTTQSEELSHAVIRGMKEVGIRSTFIRTFCDTGEEYGMPKCFVENPKDVVKKVEALIRQYGKSDDMLKIWTGPDVTWSTTRNGYETILEYCKAEKVPYSMHLQETEVDNEMCMKYYGKTAVKLLEEIGFLTEDFLAVHCVNLTDEEIDLFAKHGVSISNNPMANMYLGSGFAPIIKCLDKGVKVTLGTDGAASNNTTNMLETLKMATVTQKALYKDASIITARQIIRAATIEGAKAIKMDHLIGSIEEGKKADLVVFNPYQLTSFPMHDEAASLVYSSTLNNIETTIVNGSILYHKGEFKNNIDMEKFYANIESKLAQVKVNL